MSQLSHWGCEKNGSRLFKKPIAYCAFSRTFTLRCEDFAN